MTTGEMNFVILLSLLISPFAQGMSLSSHPFSEGTPLPSPPFSKGGSRGILVKKEGWTSWSTGIWR